MRITANDALVSRAAGVYRPEFGYEVYMHRGLGYPKYCSAAFISALESFPVRDDDVFCVGAPKSGTNWLDIITAHLYDDWGSTKITRNGIVPEIGLPDVPAVGFEGLETCLRAPGPRLMKSHLPFDHMPLAMREQGKGRVIHLTRNPKDVCDSYFDQLKAGGLKLEWPEFVNAFANGTVPNGSWLQSVQTWYAQPNSRVLHLTYEEMRRDTRAALERIVAFLGPVRPGAIDAVVKETEFEAMKKNGLDREYQPWMRRRMAKVGGWKNRFTVSESEMFDAVLVRPAIKAGVQLTFQL